MCGFVDSVVDAVSGVADVVGDIVGGVADVVGDNLPLAATIAAAYFTGGSSLAAEGLSEAAIAEIVAAEGGYSALASSGALAGAGLSEAAIADIIASEGGFSALPSAGMAGTEVAGGLQFTGGPMDNVIGNTNYSAPELVFPGGETSAIGTAPDPSILSGGTTNPGGFMFDPAAQNAGFNLPSRLPMPGFPQGANMPNAIFNPNAQTPNATPGFNPLNLIGAASGLNTMFNRSPAVDPALIRDIGQAGRNTYQASLDPQGDLYKRTQQQLQEQVRAAQSVRGTAMSPYAAGIENKAMSDFNIDWANQQLKRQVEGANAFSGAGNVAANAGVAENAQAFLQNQVGMDALTRALGGTPGGMTYDPATGQWTQAGGNPGLIAQAGSWLSNLWGNGNQWGAAPQSNFDMSQFADPNFAQNFDYGV